MRSTHSALDREGGGMREGEDISRNEGRAPQQSVMAMWEQLLTKELNQYRNSFLANSRGKGNRVLAVVAKEMEFLL
jgi:hypothetical protein